MAVEVKILEDAKKATGFSYAEIGARIGLDHTTVFRAVKDPARVTLPTLLVITQFLKISKAETVTLWRQERDRKLQARMNDKRKKIQNAAS